MRNSTPSYVDKSKKAHILVIRLSAMGDVAMTVPVLLAFHKAYPKVQITVVTKAFFTPIFAKVPNTRVFVADVKGRHKGVFGLFTLFKEVKALPIDAVADLHKVLRSSILKLFFKLSGIPVVQIDKGRKEKKRLLNAQGGHISPLVSSHQRYVQVFNALGFAFDLGTRCFLEKGEAPADLHHSDTKTPIGIAPFAAFKGKTYPLHLMKEVIAQLHSTNRYCIYLFGGGAQEKEVLYNWQQQFASCINVAGTCSFEEELQRISNLKLMVAMDSGNAHLAAMYGVPTVTLWGVTHPYAGFAPYGQTSSNSILSDRKQYPLLPTSIYGNKFPNGYEKVMETITPQQVLEKITVVLEKS